MRWRARGALAVCALVATCLMLVVQRGRPRQLFDARRLSTRLYGGGLEQTRRASPMSSSRVAWPRRLLGSPAGGVMLWAYGRSATDTFAGTLMESSKFRYCGGQKEGFTKNGGHARKGVALSQQALTKCIATDGRVTHIKPQHLVEKGSSLRTVDDLFPAVKAAGFTVVVAAFRYNQLLREVSSIELETNGELERFKRAKEYFCMDHLTQSWRKHHETWRSGTESAKRDGLDVLELSFEDVTERLCDSVRRTLARLPGWPNTCKVFHSPHTRTSHHHISLEHRVGAKAFQCIQHHFETFPDYAWMLAERVEHPPTGWNASSGTVAKTQSRTHGLSNGP